MSERERTSRPPTSSRAPAAPKRAPVEIHLDLGDDGDAPWPRSYPPPSSARASPTRSGTLRWGDFARALAPLSPSSSPVRGGTLKWGELAAAAAVARAERGVSARKSPVRGGTLKWEDLMAQLPPVLAPPPLVAMPAPELRAEAHPQRDPFEDPSLDETLAPLLSAGLVRRGGRNVARRRGFDARRDPTDPPPKSAIAALPRDLTSAIQEALEDDEEG